MSPSNLSRPGNIGETGLPRRDFIILPLLSLLTIATCLLASEVIARHFFAAQPRDSCRVQDDRIDHRYRPNCTAHLKTAEGPWVTNEYNECGYRTKESCGPKPPRTTRIALLGSSISLGEFTPYDQTFAVRLARGMTHLLGRQVQVQNLGRSDSEPVTIFYQVDEALALKPDLLMMSIDAHDIERMHLGQTPENYKPVPAIHGGSSAPDDRGALNMLKNLVAESSTATAAAHFLFLNSATYVRIYMRHGDHADYLRRPLSQAWQNRLEALDSLVAEMAGKANAQHVPVVLILTPSMAQVDLMRMRTIPTGVDPFLLPTAVQQICSRHGVQFINTLEDFRGVPDPSEAFYVVDTHLNAEGHGVVSRALIEDLMKEQRSALLGLNEPRTQNAEGQ